MYRADVDNWLRQRAAERLAAVRAAAPAPSVPAAPGAPRAAKKTFAEKGDARIAALYSDASPFGREWAILNSPEAAGRQAAARMLADRQNISVADARTVLAALPLRPYADRETEAIVACRPDQRDLRSPESAAKLALDQAIAAINADRERNPYGL